VFLVCSGLGNVLRGYESFTQQCFDALNENESFSLTLFKGANRGGTGNAIWNLPRASKANHFLARFLRRSPYYVEQLTFVISLIPYVITQRPKVIMFSDGSIGDLLWHYRKHSTQKFSLLFSNGGPLPPPFPRWDHVHQVSPEHYERALLEGVPAEKQSLIPYGLNCSENFYCPDAIEISELRKSLGLPPSTKIVVSVGTLNSSHKRMDYVIRELAALPPPRPFLLMLGEPDHETPAIRRLADELLGPSGSALRTVPADEVGKNLRASDLFVLASLGEGFGRVLLEAMSEGLPCLVNEYRTSRFILEDFGRYGDFTRDGALTALLRTTLPTASNRSDRIPRHAHLYRRFAWPRLRSAYLAMIAKAASATTPANREKLANKVRDIAT
jgi:glycosyltransferase involved in cell wall biosynthesis